MIGQGRWMVKGSWGRRPTILDHLWRKPHFETGFASLGSSPRSVILKLKQKFGGIMIGATCPVAQAPDKEW
jgi:hypothetical protein